MEKTTTERPSPHIVRGLLLVASVTVEDLASETGCSLSYVQYVIAGKRNGERVWPAIERAMERGREILGMAGPAFAEERAAV